MQFNSVTMTGYVFDIKKFAIHDGPGIRTTVFLQGCPLKCKWCHNPESMRETETEFCEASNGLSSRKYFVDELMTEIRKDSIFFDESGGGVTFSGGEPLVQLEFLSAMLHECGKNDIRTTVDTCGYAPFESFEEILYKVDLFLYDLKLFDDALHLNYTGVSNKMVLENLAKLSGLHKNIILRVPLIPGITDTDENLTAIAKFVKGLNNISKIDLLPYNELAASKYKRLNRENSIGKLETQAENKLNEFKLRVEQFGFEVKLKG